MTTHQAVRLIAEEVDRAEAKHPKWDGQRHGHSIIEEEYVEFRDAIFADDPGAALTEVIQLGAMCARFLKNHGGTVPERAPLTIEAIITKATEKILGRSYGCCDPEYWAATSSAIREALKEMINTQPF